MSFTRRPKRIAGPGFNINVRYDDVQRGASRTNIQPHPYLPIARNDEVYDVKEQELLVTNRQSGMYHDGYAHCFSCLNGYELEPNKHPKEILGMVSFIGIALTEYKPSKSLSEQGFVAQVGGVVTIINEGNETIFPGDTLCLAINVNNRHIKTADKGIPREKIRFCVEPVKASDLNDPKYQIIGKAYSHARQGDRFEMGINVPHPRALVEDQEDEEPVDY